MNPSSPFPHLLALVLAFFTLASCDQKSQPANPATINPNPPNVPSPRHTLPMSSHDFDRIVEADPFLQKLDTRTTVKTKVYDLKNDSLWMVILHRPLSDYELDIAIRGYQKGNGFSLVLEAEVFRLAYSGDTLMDVDFDGDYDYVYHTYSTTGCCYRDQAYVHFNNNGKVLPTPYSILNPYFDAEHQTVQTMGYGYPPDVSLNKHIWQADTLFLIESVYVNTTFTEGDTTFRYTGDFTIVNERTGEEWTVDSIPSEYTYLSDHYSPEMWGVAPE